MSTIDHLRLVYITRLYKAPARELAELIANETDAELRELKRVALEVQRFEMAAEFARILKHRDAGKWVAPSSGHDAFRPGERIYGEDPVKSFPNQPALSVGTSVFSQALQYNPMFIKVGIFSRRNARAVLQSIAVATGDLQWHESSAFSSYPWCVWGSDIAIASVRAYIKHNNP